MEAVDCLISCPSAEMPRWTSGEFILEKKKNKKWKNRQSIGELISLPNANTIISLSFLQDLQLAHPKPAT